MPDSNQDRPTPVYPIDAQFFALIDEIKSLTAAEIESQLIRQYQVVPLNIRLGLEDFFAKYSFWGSLNDERQDYELLKNRSQTLHEHHQDLLWLYHHLKDYRSRHLLFAIINNWFHFDFESLNFVLEVLYGDYFDMDIIRCGPEEVMVDLGAYTGDSVQRYITRYGAYKRIYCYEISPEMIRQLQQNLGHMENVWIRQKGASDASGWMYLQENGNDISANCLAASGSLAVETVKLDDDITEPITLLKMDIEGSEQAALRGCAGHIRKEKPKLAISVYHSHEDLWKIPRMIDEMCPGYSFYLRYRGRNLSPTEITLLAVFE